MRDPNFVPVAVVALSRSDDLLSNAHDRATHDRLARGAAELLDLPYRGEYRSTLSEPVLLVPADTLLATEAKALGLRGAAGLWGGVVPYPHVATKAITHGLIAPDAKAPPGWNPALAEALSGAVLSGATTFDAGDALEAGRILLERGPIRLKPVLATGGRGQTVAADQAALEAALQARDPDEIGTHGVVLEENLVDITTYSVGTSALGDHRIAYWGLQRFEATADDGEVYAGSDLEVAQGGLDDLLAFDLPQVARTAIEIARRYDAAAFAAYPGLFASRRNYDVITGRDQQGRQRVGVLEQSWRVGGASGAELAAMQAFARDRTRRLVRSFTMELRSEAAVIPPDATVYFQGIDPIAGPMTKYAGLRP